MKKKREAMPSFPGTRSSDYHRRVVCGALVFAYVLIDVMKSFTVNDAKLIVHVDQSCNECGNCACHCVEPCQPYKDRITFFHNAEALADSTNDGFYIKGTSCGYRFKGEEAVCDIDAIPEELKGVVHASAKSMCTMYHDYHGQQGTWS